MKTKHSDIIGRKYNRLTIIGIIEKSNLGDWRISCKCDCGKIIETTKYSVIYNNARSCGCYRTDKIIKRCRLEYGESTFNHLYRAYKRRAIQKKIVFSLTKEEFRKLTRQNCYYCNAEPNNLLNIKHCFGEYTYNGIGRMNNNLGYTVKNSVTCCGFCNRMKMEHSIEIFLKYIKNIYEFLRLDKK